MCSQRGLPSVPLKWRAGRWRCKWVGASLAVGQRRLTPAAPSSGPTVLRRVGAQGVRAGQEASGARYAEGARHVCGRVAVGGGRADGWTQRSTPTMRVAFGRRFAARPERWRDGPLAWAGNKSPTFPDFPPRMPPASSLGLVFSADLPQEPCQGPHQLLRPPAVVFRLKIATPVSPSCPSNVVCPVGVPEGRTSPCDPCRFDTRRRSVRPASLVPSVYGRR